MDDTPILRHSFTRKQLSAIAALSFRQFYFCFFAGAIRTEQIIEFLGALGRHMEKPLLIVRDGAAIHRSRKLNAWQEGLNGHIALARLPCLRPETQSGGSDLGLNTIGEVGPFARNRLKSMQRRPALINAFWKQAELNF
ncbi:transposase [Verminephrobacter eiseniae]|uniref:Tc1-like transposase DDE domain-containing protein n=1 Tax=Verminephrobacter eiseniae (strain EF01-2) TaxID=391735 RepID=A1WN60_VEREI|nr:transposase [Verminephrobacter eiseniae]ABM59067.1 hypothetical protein Veis_3338 [Verminephrobacter eiseniae EF01-2]